MTAAPVSTGATDPGTWVERHGDALWRFASARLRCPQLTEEVVQETFLAALEARRSFLGNSSERTWLIAILRNKIADALRRSRLERSRGGGWGGAFEGMFTPQSDWAVDVARWPSAEHASAHADDLRRELSRCLARLPPSLAQTFFLREVQSLDTAAMCESLRVTQNHLWVRLHRARVLLRQCMARFFEGR